jgi:hypothetical protein
MDKDEAIEIARQFAAQNRLPFGPPFSVTSELFQDRPAWRVDSLADRLGGGRLSFKIDEQSGHVVDHDPYSD